MNTAQDAERQGQPVGLRRPHAQLTLMFSAEAFDSALDSLANDENVRASDELRESLDHVLSEAKAEAAAIRNLATYRPLFEIDGKLHEMRRKILADRAKREGWQISWSQDGSAIIDIGWGVINVDRCDNWTAPSGTQYGDFCAHGLTSLLAHLNGEHVAITTAKISRWLDKRENAK